MSSFLARIGDALGFSTKKERLGMDRRGQVIPDLALWSQSARIGGGLTPARVSSIIRQADSGDMASLMDLANESRQKDCHLQSVLGTGEEAIAGLPWQLVPPEDALKKETTAAKQIEEALRATPTFERLIAHLAGAVYYGRGVGETLWKKDGGKLVPEAFGCLAPRRFAFRQGDGRLVWRDEGMPHEGVDFQALYPHKFIVSQPRVTGDVPQREGLCRVLIWAALFRNWTLTDWLRTGEISWKPWRIGTYDKNASTEDIEGLETVLRQLTTEGAAKLPATCTLKVEWPGGTGMGGKATHAELANMLAQEMSKATLGQTETVQSSASSGYAQAKVMDGVRKDLRESRARHVAHVLTGSVVASMVAVNYDGVRVPRLVFQTQDAIDLASFGKAILDMSSAGLVIPQKWARDQAGIPEPEDDEETFGGTEIPITEMPVEEPEEPEETPPEPPTKAERRAKLFADVKGARDAGLVVTQEDVERMAGEHDVDAPQLAAPATVEPSAVEKAEHQARQGAALLADIREAKAIGAPLTQDKINETAARYGVPTVELE